MSIWHFLYQLSLWRTHWLEPCCSFGPTLHLTSSAIEAMFPRAFERIGVGFYRSKITSWMAAQEEDYR